MAKTEVDHINDALEETDREIFLLCQRRSRLRSRLNGLVSATRNLPPEVLTEIFRLSACKINLREPQLYSIDVRMVLKLGSICSHWRRVAWAAPHLWATCLLTYNNLIPPSVIALALSNSQGGCVAARADLRDMPSESMLLLFRHHCARVRALRIHLNDNEHSYQGWDQAATYFTQPTEWPNLKELWVCLPDEEESSGLVLQIPGADSFHHCRREHDNLTWYPPMHQLTVLRLRRLPIDQCLYLLLYCPGLTEFHCFDPDSSFFSLFDPKTLLGESHHSGILPNLRIFRWGVVDHDWNFFLFSSIRFPNLERFGWADPRVYDPLPQVWTHNPQCALVNEFIPALNNIIALDWETPTESLYSFKNVFAKANLNSLQRLYIRDLSRPGFIGWLKALTIDEQYDRERQQQHHFPELRAIHVETLHVELGEPITFNVAYTFLRSRRRNPLLSDNGDDMNNNNNNNNNNNIPGLGRWRTPALLERFTLQITEAPLHLSQYQMKALKELVDGGLIFELILPTEEFSRTTTLE